MAVALLAACGSDGDASTRHVAGAAPPVEVAAAFYPLEYVVEQVGADHVVVTNLTPPGVEPHDLELSARDVAALHDADLVIYLAGFTPALDDAVEAAADDLAVFDVAPHARLTIERGAEDHGHEHPDRGQHGDDPHFWLDPTRLADVADAVAHRLAEADADNAASYAANAARLRGRLLELDRELAAGLADCSRRDLVTSHAAFGYLAERYGLVQVGIATVSPDEEPSPAALADIVRFVEEHDVRTIYSETLVDPAIAETVAREADVDMAVLDPIEGIADDSAVADYVAVMRANLASLRAGQGCA